jgi:myo-inositol-1(or 4)-monophosphatase
MEVIKNKIAEILTQELKQYFGPSSVTSLSFKEKIDKSVVTTIDQLISNSFKNLLSTHQIYKNYSFYSEEDYSSLEFPAAILDPIDGTIELLKGRPECAVSLAIMNSPEISDPKNYGWIYNPFSGFSMDSNSMFHSHLNRSSQQTMGFVSRSEWHKGFYRSVKDKSIVLVPRGSIAFKLGLLASGACDFVVSLAPKNIWDIAAGTILLHQRGINFYCNGNKISRLDQVCYGDKLIWCQENLNAKLHAEFINEK